MLEISSKTSSASPPATRLRTAQVAKSGAPVAQTDIARPPTKRSNKGLRLGRSGRSKVVAASTTQHFEGMSASGVRRDKAALSSGCKSHPANAAGSSRSSYGGDEVAEAFGMRVTNW
jgi:hypothetical protein